MKIRDAMIETPTLMQGICEMDETYIGARKPRRNAKYKDDNGNYPPLRRVRGTLKTPIVGIVEREAKLTQRLCASLSFKT